MRLRITVDFTRTPKVEPVAHVEPEPAEEYAPQVTVKGSHILERRPLTDYDTRPAVMGFTPNEGDA